MEAAIHSAHRRRGNNEGSIKKRRDGRWEAQYSVKRPTDGKTVRRSLYGKSRQEVQEKLQEILVSIHQDEYIEPSRITVEQWLYQWLRVYCLSLKKNSTCTGYEDEIKLHVVPYLGSIRLQDLKPQQVQLAINALVQQGKAPATVRKAHAILHAALRRAVIDQMIKHNPSEFTVLPKMERRDIHYLTQTEQKRFIQHLPDCSVGRALYFILGTGIRAGELSGLRWSDVQDDRFTVRQTVRRNRDFAEDAPTRTHLEFGTPKSNAGHRTIPLTSRMQELILEHQQRQAATRRAKGEEWNDHDLVFCTEIGTPYELRNLNRVLHRTLKKANLHTMGVHSLRHSFATRAVEAGMDNDWLGNRSYASPEQLLRGNAQNVTSACDVYAVGMVINEMFTRKKPTGSKYTKVADVFPALLSLDPLLDRCMLQNPSERPTINAVLAQLKLLYYDIQDAIAAIMYGGHILVKFELKTDSISCMVRVSVPSL